MIIEVGKVEMDTMVECLDLTMAVAAVVAKARTIITGETIRTMTSKILATVRLDGILATKTEARDGGVSQTPKPKTRRGGKPSRADGAEVEPAVGMMVVTREDGEAESMVITVLGAREVVATAPEMER